MSNGDGLRQIAHISAKDTPHHSFWRDKVNKKTVMSVLAASCDVTGRQVEEKSTFTTATDKTDYKLAQKFPITGKCSPLELFTFYVDLAINIQGRTINLTAICSDINRLPISEFVYLILHKDTVSVH